LQILYWRSQTIL